MDGPRMDFGFGFNDTVFSDRVLRIEVISDSLDSEGDCVSNRKRRRKDLDKENVVQVKTLQVNSLLLAASSPFFYKLFKNGMKESQQRDVTMKISASEDAALMDILKFIYSNTLSSALPDLLGVLIVADKFEVTSCTKYCSELLKESPMSLESALLYLELVASVSLGEVVQPLIAAAKKYLVERYSDFHKCENEVMDLPLCAIEVVFSGVGLQVTSEDDVFDFILKWARKHYPMPIKERREILTNRLVKCLCFPSMSCSKLKEVLACPDFGHEKVSKLVLEALFVKVEAPYLQHNAYKDLTTTNFNSLGRIYEYRPIRVVQLHEFPQPRCIVYFYLRKEECENLSKTQWLYSQRFNLGGRQFYLKAKYDTSEDQPGTFGLYLCMAEESESCTLEYDYAVMKKSSKEFQNKLQDTHNYVYSTTSLGWGYSNLLGISWSDFLSEDSEYFIDGILHLRADLTIYEYRPIRVVQLEFPQPRCIVYFCLRKEECENILQTRPIYSELFDLGGRQFYLEAKYDTSEEQPGTFGLYLYMVEESESCTLEYEYAVIKKSTKEFENMVKDTANFPDEGNWGWGDTNLLGIPWTEFVSEDSEYFIDGILHLRAELTINA